MMISSSREAGLQDVINKITKRIRDSELANRLVEKVTQFFHTKNPADDLNPAEVSAIYHPNEYGDDFDMPGGKELDVGWSNHAEYRTDLRDIDPTRVNEAVRNFAEAHPNKHQKVNLINHSIGKAVVDINTMVQPERAGVITVIASERFRRIAERVVTKIRRMCVYDFDDTLVSSESSVSVQHEDGENTVLDSASFAYFKGVDGDNIDFSDFNNVTKPRIIKKNMAALKKDVESEDTKVVILTARPKGSASAVTKFLESLGISGVDTVALQSSDPMDKARWIEQQVGDLDEVEFTDDSSRNTKAVDTLKGKIKAKVKTINTPHPSKDSDYEGDSMSEVFESDSPTKALVTVQDEVEKPLHQTSTWWKKQTPEFQQQYCKDHKDSAYCQVKAASDRGVIMASNDLKKQVLDRVAKIKSAKVKKYVRDSLLKKIDQAGDAAAFWMEKLENSFDQLKSKGLMSGFEQEDFNDLWFVITGDEKDNKRVSMNISRIAERIVESAISKKAPDGMLLVQLAAMPNPDFGDESWESQIKIVPRFVPVRTMKDAVQEVSKFIKENNLGGGNWTGGKVVDDAGNVVAQISYNRRVWKPGKYPQPEINVQEFDKDRK